MVMLDPLTAGFDPNRVEQLDKLSKVCVSIFLCRYHSLLVE